MYLIVHSNGGLSEGRVMGMDMLAFRSAYDSIKRLKAQERVDDAIDTMYAAQGTGENLKDHLKPIEEVANSVLGPPPVKGPLELIAKFGKGI